MRVDSIKKNLPWVLLGLAMAGSASLILSLTASITFITDEWDMILLRPGWSPDSFLAPFHEHIVIAPALSYKLFQSIFGIDSPRPTQLAAVAMFLASCLLFFIWAKARIGDWAALIGAAILLFLGAAFEDLLWAFQIGYFGSLACGIGALIALDRNDRKGDFAASILLVGSLTFSSLGMPFVAGAAVEWILNPRDRKRRWFVPGAAMIFYVLWWLGWGREAESAVSLSNLPDVPKYIFDAASAGMTSMLGLATGDGSEPDQPNLIWGRLALIALMAASVWRLVSLKRIPTGLLITAAIALAFFGLAGLGQSDLRPPTSSRYQLPAVVFILLVCVELLRGIKLPPWSLIVAAAVVVATSISGVDLMRDQAEARWQPASKSIRTSLGAIAVAGESTRDDYVLDLGFSSTVPIDRYLEEIQSTGSPGFSEDELTNLDAAHRGLADSTLIDTKGIWLSGQPPATSSGQCQSRKVPAGIPVRVDPSPKPIEVINPSGQELEVSVIRFGDPPGNPVGSIFPKSRAWLSLTEDNSDLPWRLIFSSPGGLKVCQ